jgi:hypothetical protein
MRHTNSNRISDGTKPEAELGNKKHRKHIGEKGYGAVICSEVAEEPA